MKLCTNEIYFRIHELQLEVADYQEKLEIAEHGIKNYSKQVSDLFLIL